MTRRISFIKKHSVRAKGIKFRIVSVHKNQTPHTLLSWYQNIEPGGSGPNRIVHVRLMVLPLSTYRSGPPNIVAIGSAPLRPAISTEKKDENTRIIHY